MTIKTFYKVYYNLLRYIFYSLPLLIILGNAAINFSLALVSLLYFVQIIYEKKIIFVNRPEFKVFVIFYIYLIFNSLISLDPETSLIRTIPFLKFFIFSLVFINLLEEKIIDIKKLGLIWFILLSILSLDILFQSIVGHNIFGFKSNFANRNSSFFFDELVAGGFIFSLVFITLKILFKKQNNFFEQLLILIFFIIIFLTGERSSFVKYFLILIISFYFYFKYQNYLKKIFLIFLIFLSSIFIYNSPIFKDRYLGTISYSPERNLGIINNYLRSPYGSHAISSFYILKENFLFGVGNKNFRIACKAQKEKVINYQKIIDPNARVYLDGCSTHPHQIYFELLSEHGIFGSMLILFLMYKLISQKIKKHKLLPINLYALFFLIIAFLPILPSGSFFTTSYAMLFWLNFVFFSISDKK